MSLQRSYRVDRLAAENRRLRRMVQDLQRKVQLLATSQRAMCEALASPQSSSLQSPSSSCYESCEALTSMQPFCEGQGFAFTSSESHLLSYPCSRSIDTVSMEEDEPALDLPSLDGANDSPCAPDITHETESQNPVDKQLLDIYDNILTLDEASHKGKPDSLNPSAGKNATYTLYDGLTMPFDLSNIASMGLVSGVLDAYIMHIRQILSEELINKRLKLEQLVDLARSCVLWVVREAWPNAEHYWRTTGSFEGFLAVEMWRNFPSQQTYQALHPAYRPTAVQLSRAHPAIVDWLPWPSIRDSLILSQDSLDVDLVCKSAIENVVAHRGLATKRSRNEREKETSGSLVSFRVYDLCMLEEQSGYHPPPGGDLVYKAKSAPVKALEQAYRLECSNFFTQKLHPSFFDDYPSLYCDSAVSTFKVQTLDTVKSRHKVVGRPIALSQNAKANLRGILGDAMLPAMASLAGIEVND